MIAPFRNKVGARAVALALALASSSFSAHAVLERVGPVSVAPTVGGFPTWYQDTSGLALEFCNPSNAAELDGAWCLLLPDDIPLIPENFPSNFFDEHFFFAAGAAMDTRQAGKANLVIGLESAFSVGPAIPGDQIVFARIRVVFNPVPMTGTYRFIHPYGEEVLEGIAGDRIFFSDDFGATCSSFECALNGRMGPFLLPSATPGGAEMPPLTAANPVPDADPNHWNDGVFSPTPYPGTGKAYIADPAREGPVTGSPLPDFIDSTGALRNHNIWRIEGPVGSGIGTDPVTGAPLDWIETPHFALMGRIYSGAMPGRVTVERASYGRIGTAQKLDVFATAVATTTGRLPATQRPVQVVPTLTFFDAPCAGTVDAVGTIRPPYSTPLGATETPMNAQGALQSAQTLPIVMPSTVCVKDASAKDVAGNPVPIYVMHPVTDEVTVTPAFYDPAAGTLTVGASSSDTVLAPTLSLAYAGVQGNLAAGQIVVPGTIAPPSSVLVRSSALGTTQYQVSTGFAAGAPAVLPLAVNDSFSFPMNSGANVLAVLGNDSNVAGGTVTLASAPAFGTAVANADGTVSYTPNLNMSGTDAFTYTVNVAGQVSNTALATLDVTPVALPPVAVNESVNAIANTPLPINVIGNDTDPNGSADIVAAVNVSQPTPAGATTSVAGGIVTFNATSAGTYTFTYQAQDAAGLVSANAATTTVQVAAAETLAFQLASYRRDKSLLRASGTVSPIAQQTIRLDFVDSTGTVLGTAGTVNSTVLGGWSMDKTVAMPAGSVSLKATTSNGTARATALSIK